MGLDGLVGDGALGSGHGLGDGGRGMDGWGSNAMDNSSSISAIASLRGSIGDGSSQTGVSNKLLKRYKIITMPYFTPRTSKTGLKLSGQECLLFGHSNVLMPTMRRHKTKCHTQ